MVLKSVADAFALLSMSQDIQLARRIRGERA